MGEERGSSKELVISFVIGLFFVGIGMMFWGSMYGSFFSIVLVLIGILYIFVAMKKKKMI